MCILKLKKIPYYTSSQIITLLSNTNIPGLIKEAYARLYNPLMINKKLRVALSESHDIVFMPFSDHEGIVASKAMLLEKEEKTPGVFGWLILYDRKKKEPVAIFDATALTGIRTAAKSLLVSQQFFDNEKLRQIYIYGSSTQAIHHFNQFSKFYTKSVFHFIVRSKKSADRIRQILANKNDNINITNDHITIKQDPDIIITATKSETPLITNKNLRSAKLLIAVGSSSGEQSEIDLGIVSTSTLLVDAFISISGKGELNLALQDKLISLDDITELHTLLVSNKTLSNDKPVLFVSKGLAIEDYIVAMKVIELA